MPDRPSQHGRLKVEMPSIPGVGHGLAPSSPPAPGRYEFKPPEEQWATPSRGGFSPVRWAMLLAALCLATGLGWWAIHASRSKAAALVAADAGLEVAPPAEVPAAPPLAPPKLSRSGATIVASLGELAKPWTAKKFIFADPVTHEQVAAMIVRLPGGAADRRESYWAFSLTAPFKTCSLEYVADLAQLSTRYGYRANHPMVVAACDASVYDPLKVQTVGSGAWVRGEVMSGAGIRPPLAIDIAVQGDSIVADRME